MSDNVFPASMSERARKTMKTNGFTGAPMIQPSLTTGAQPTGVSVPKERLVGWYSKILDGVRQRSRKLQRLARCVNHLRASCRYV